MKVPAAFIAGVHLRWDSVRQRPQHILSRIAERVPLIVIEEPQADDADWDDVRQYGAITVIRPFRTTGWNPPFVDDRCVASARALAGAGPLGVWLYTPMMLELADAFDAAPLVFDCMDELAAFDFAPAGIADRDRRLVDRADCVFTGGRSLYERRTYAGAKVHLYPSGVEFERFAADVAAHPLPAELRSPVFCYVGVIDERIDMRCLEALADAYPHGNIVMVGPVAKIDARTLPQRPNVHFTGAQPYASLPAFLAGCDVAIMPFAANRATENISPTKTLEYFAASLPVVSTRIADVVASYGDIVYLADDPREFVRAAGLALTPDAGRIERGRAAAHDQTWDAIVARMWNDLFG